MSPIRVLIADDHAILRDGIRSVLEHQEDMAVVGEAANGVEALRLAGELLPDIVLMDIAMPLMDGLEATRHIKEELPTVKVLILTQHDSREYITPLLKAGAAGYVLKRSGSREVVGAIREVSQYGAFLQPEVARQVLQDYRRPTPDPRASGVGLTEREREITRLVVKGQSNKEIARLLAISPKTVSVHRTNIMSKLGVQNSADLVRYVIQNKLVELD